MARAAKAIIHLEAIKANYRLAKSHAPGANAVAVVKADAYGHGAVAVAQALESTVDAFAVACIEEALALREAGIQAPILLLEGFFSASELNDIVQQRFWICVHNSWQLSQLARVPESAALQVWLKMDTGMHRLGFAPGAYLAAYEQLRQRPQVAEVVAMTHLACADEPQQTMTADQLVCFQRQCADLDIAYSIANSAGILAWPESHHQWLRPGLMLYGASPFVQRSAAVQGLQAAMQLTTEVIAVRDLAPGDAVGYGATWRAERPSRIATLAMGYGDGYPRHARPGTPLWVSGQLCPLVGRVSMDMITVDVTELDHVMIGSEVECWGARLPINQVATHCDTIPYTLMTGVTPRVPRQYR